MKNLILSTAIIVTSCIPVAAQTLCGSLMGFAEFTVREGFEQQSRGGLDGGMRMQTWASDDGRYVILAILPNGAGACIIAQGENYRNSNPGGDL